MTQDSLITNSGVIVNPQPNGHLKCVDDQVYWCKHIEEIVRHAGDAEVLWSDPSSDVAIEVPMIPSANQWARVVLTHRTIGTPVYEVMYVGADYDKSEFLGFIHPGEARNVLRSMIYDWFRGHVDFDKIKCESTSHRFSQQMKWEKDMADPTNQVAQFWSVWTTKTCLACTFNEGDIADLIPDLDRRMPGSH